MATRLSRIQRELGDLLARFDAGAEHPLERDGALGARSTSATPSFRRRGVRARMNELLALGVSHKTAPVALRERLAFTERRRSSSARLLTPLASEPLRLSEAVAISTCNRTELYLVVDGPPWAESQLLGRSRGTPEIRADGAGGRRSTRRATATRRATSSASRRGLESMVVGEDEIQGQVRRAYEAARETGSRGPLINRLFTAALTTGKLVRVADRDRRAAASASPRSPSTSRAALLGTLADRHVIILGAGETSELTAQALARQGAGTIFVANRHADRARSVAERFGGEVVSLEQPPRAARGRRHRRLLDLLPASHRRAPTSSTS